jgi:hypothetical protein
MPKTLLAIDQMVDFLTNEDKYWRQMVINPMLWSQKKVQHAKVQQKQLHKRQTLDHYILQGNPDLTSRSILVTDNLLYKEEGITTTTNDDDNDIMDLTSIPNTPSSTHPALFASVSSSPLL